MPRTPKKARVRNMGQNGQHLAQTDFTVHDFADTDHSGSSGSRIKKGMANAVTKDLRQLKGGDATTKSEELAWYEKDLADFDVEEGACDGEEIQDDKDEDKTTVPSVRRKKKHKSGGESEGRDYPMDLWYILGNYVAPSDVGKFASICRSSHAITHTASFWFSLYRRYLDEEKDIPDLLTPRFMEKLNGLRGRVIRTLFYLYPPYIERQKSIRPFEGQPDCLQGYTCILMWYQKVKNHWHFYFKFTRLPKHVCPLSKLAYNKGDQLWRFTPNIHENPEEGCSVLQIIARNFLSLPCVMGQVLAKTFLSVSHGMRYHKLRLVFNGQQMIQSDKQALMTGVNVVIDPVIDIRIHRWWDTKYPCNGTGAGVGMTPE